MTPAPRFSGWRVPMPDMTDTGSRIVTSLEVNGHPAGDIAWLIDRLRPSVARAWRKEVRDRGVRALAALHADFGQRNTAARIAKELARYAASGWRFERGRQVPADDPVRAAMHAILTATGGEPPGFEAIRKALAGLDLGRNSRVSAPADVRSSAGSDDEVLHAQAAGHQKHIRRG
jgi:hypothetical protein